MPIIKQNQGKIISLIRPFKASQWFKPVAYRVSKVSLNRLIQTLAVDTPNQKLPISIFSIFPGGVSTDPNGHR